MLHSETHMRPHGTDGRVAPSAPARPIAAGPAEPPAPGARWFALRTRSRSEFAVRDALAAQGFEQFLPTWEQRTAWSDRIAKVTRPLFTGYIFSRFVPELAQDAVLQTRGVCNILGCVMGEPEAIPDAVIASLQRMAAAGPDALSLCPYVAGERIKVRCGAYAGIEGTVVRTDGEMHLVVSVELLGRACRVKIDAADIE